jgi:hypothetical protein
VAGRIAVQGLWFDGALPLLQQISVASFLANGHDYHLYTYGTVEDVPPGTKFMDAGEILPRSSVFPDRGGTGFAAFADIFRYKLLLERGGWWVDTDFVCLRVFDFEKEYVFSSEHAAPPANGAVPNNGVLKAPPGAPVMRHALDVCESKDLDRIVWAELGPALMAEAIPRFSLEWAVAAPEVFCPVPWFRFDALVDPELQLEFGREVYAVHGWNALWRRHGRSLNAAYDPRCLYERWKLEYLDQPASHQRCQSLR